MKIIFYKIVNNPEFEFQLSKEAKAMGSYEFLPFNEDVKKRVLGKEYKANIGESIVLVCNSFTDLTLNFTLLQIADLLERGINLAIKNEPELTTITQPLIQNDDIIVGSGGIKKVIAVLRAIASAQTVKVSGRPATVISNDFVEDYWNWQLEKISTKEIMNSDNRGYSFSTTTQFYALAKRYENTTDYFTKQQEYALQLISIKKHGKVDKKVFIDYATKNPQEVLDEKSISYLKGKLGVNTIDFWRCVLNFYVTKAYAELPFSPFKSSIEYAVSLMKDSNSKKFFIEDSICGHKFSSYDAINLE